MKSSPGRLGIIASLPCHSDQGTWSVPSSMGRVIDGLAKRFDSVSLCAPTRPSPATAIVDYRLSSVNLTIVSQPDYSSILAAQVRIAGILRAYLTLFRSVDAVLVRGLCPAIPFVYALAFHYRIPVCHWIVGDHVAVARTDRRSGWLRKYVSIAYSLLDRYFVKAGRWLTDGALICNGEEMASIFRSKRTVSTVSTTITEDEIFPRTDTCRGDVIKLLFVGHIRPEKGLEYLLAAMSELKSGHSWSLNIVGPVGKFVEYENYLKQLVSQYRMADSISWSGPIAFGPSLFKVYQDSDIFVFPSLSEGTPRVLVEARANGVPVIATRVGGIPSSIRDGVDGVLVPARDSIALARAIERMVEDGDFRRSMIHEGLNRVRTLTVDRFVDLLVESFRFKKASHE